jgi:4-aminobutyrate aminotransferase/(S)-3-amino-2-methylpropionate transaminase
VNELLSWPGQTTATRERFPSAAGVDAMGGPRLPQRRELRTSIPGPQSIGLQHGDPRIGDVRGRGATIGVEYVRPGTQEPDDDLTKRVAATAHRNGVIVLTCGTFGNVVRLLPPLTIPTDLLLEGLDVVADAMEVRS